MQHHSCARGVRRATCRGTNCVICGVLYLPLLLGSPGTFSLVDQATWPSNRFSTHLHTPNHFTTAPVSCRAPACCGQWQKRPHTHIDKPQHRLQPCRLGQYTEAA